MNRKVEKKTDKIVTEFLKYEDGNIFLLNTCKFENKCTTTLYYCSLYDGFDFKYNPDGTIIHTTETNLPISKHHHEALDKLFFSFEDTNKYNRFLNALKD